MRASMCAIYLNMLFCSVVWYFKLYFFPPDFIYIITFSDILYSCVCVCVRVIYLSMLWISSGVYDLLSMERFAFKMQNDNAVPCIILYYTVFFDVVRFELKN